MLAASVPAAPTAAPAVVPAAPPAVAVKGSNNFFDTLANTFNNWFASKRRILAHKPNKASRDRVERVRRRAAKKGSRGAGDETHQELRQEYDAFRRFLALASTPDRIHQVTTAWNEYVSGLSTAERKYLQRYMSATLPTASLERGSRAELPPLPEYREPKVKRWFRDPELQRSAQDLLYKLAAVYAAYLFDPVGETALRAALANLTPADVGINAAEEARISAFWTPPAKQALQVFEFAMTPGAARRVDVRHVRRFFGDLDAAYPGLRLGVIMERRTQRQLAKLQREFDQAAQSFGADAPFPIGAAPPFPPPRRTGAEVR